MNEDTQPTLYSYSQILCPIIVYSMKMYKVVLKQNILLWYS